MVIKKSISLLIIITLIFSSINVFGLKIVKQEGNTKTLSTRELKEWTFMAYLDHDYYDLEDVLIKYINDMEEIGSNDYINIIAQVDDYNLWEGKTRIYEIIKDTTPGQNNIISSIVNEDQSEKNMGDPQTLIDFVKWTSNEYPAKHYCLLLFDHGKGWYGLCNDYTNQDRLDLAELTSAFSGITNHIGKKIDMVIYFTCLMGMIEVLYETKEFVDITISSEDNAGKQDLLLKKITQILEENPQISANSFAQKIIDENYFEFQNLKYHIFFGIEMNKIDSLSHEVSVLSSLLIQNMPDRNYLLDMNQCSVVDDTSPYSHDLYTIVEYISQKDQSGPIKASADKIKEEIESCVIRPLEDEDDYIVSYLNGISIYYPPKKSDLFSTCYDSNYEKLEFAKNTYWDDFILASYSKTKNKNFQLFDNLLSNFLKNCKTLNV